MTPRTVAICIPTYRRPELLRGLLRSLQALTFKKVSEPETTIVVIDNDPAGSARGVVAEFLSRRYRLRYRIESRKGISFARNAAIETARGADFLAFIDDDEEASPSWLDELLTVQAAFAAPIVAGPVLPRFQDRPPQWIVEGGFFLRRRHVTGTQLTSVGAGNVLLSRKVLHTLSPGWFDNRFTLTGGEDTHFFRRCATLGFLVTWSDDAIAYESIPTARLSEKYLVARARDGGNHWTRVDLELRPTIAHLGTRFAVGLLRILQGSAVSLVAPALPPARQLRGQLWLAEGLGNLQAFLGRSYESYGSFES